MVRFGHDAGSHFESPDNFRLEDDCGGQESGRWAIPAPMSSHHLEQVTFVVFLLGIFSHNHSPFKGLPLKYGYAEIAPR